MNMTIAERVKFLRKQEGLTQEQLAQALFISDAAISHIENGTRKPSKGIAMKLAERYKKINQIFFSCVIFVPFLSFCFKILLFCRKFI